MNNLIAESSEYGEETNIELLMKQIDRLKEVVEYDASDSICGLAVKKITTLTTQIERMRGALEQIAQENTGGRSYHLLNCWEACSRLAQAVLKPLPPSQFVLIERSELEKWPCGCHRALDNRNPHSAKPVTVKCLRCIALDSANK